MDQLQTVALICTSLVAIAGFIAGIWWIVRKIVHIADAAVQLLPNGGGSLADKINKINTTLVDVVRMVDDLDKRMETLETNVVEPPRTARRLR